MAGLEFKRREYGSKSCSSKSIENILPEGLTFLMSFWGRPHIRYSMDPEVRRMWLRDHAAIQ